jgi:calcineurin-like phosphoesterase family protein
LVVRRENCGSGRIKGEKSDAVVYFTADTHFYHENIIRYCNRPFKNVEEMNETIIANWNSVVRPVDCVYVIGDFIFGSPKKQIERLKEVVKRLKGNIFLIKGSHDRLESYQPSLLGDDAERFHIFEDRLVTISIENQEIVLCHYALRVWPKSHYGAWHLYGHSHGRLGDWGKSLDVGVDCWNFRPLSFFDIKNIMKGKPDNFDLIEEREED